MGGGEGGDGSWTRLPSGCRPQYHHHHSPSGLVQNSLSLWMEERERERERERSLLVGGLLNVPATCLCISGTHLLRQFYVMPP